MENTSARWSKSSPSWGSALRITRNYYAYMVTMVVTGGAMVCPSCDSALDLDTAEVDRVCPTLDYREGNVIYLCRACNQQRGILQSTGNDWTHVSAYAALVSSASESVEIPTVSSARAWWDARPTAEPVSRWA